VRDRVRVGLRDVVARPPDLGYLDGRIRVLLRRKYGLA
jgi:DNA-binding response OmpR family regulator